MIPEFDPSVHKVDSWLSIVQTYALTFSWSDRVICYQALNKLKGSAKIWYDSLLRTNFSWPTWEWSNWKSIIASTFRVQRNMFDILKDIIDKKPANSQSLYEFYFEQKGKIDSLSLNFSQHDIISIILGNIGDSNISASVEAGQFKSCDELASFLHSKVRNVSGRVLVQKQMPNQSVINSNSNVPSTLKAANETYNVAMKQKVIKCFSCGGNHKRSQCEVNTCDFCKKRGHIESECFTKKKLKPEKQETKLVSVINAKNKFIKIITINNKISHEAFIDSGSSCSLISNWLVNKYGFKKYLLDIPVTLQGFSIENLKTVTYEIIIDITIDSVSLKNIHFYILDTLADCDILIGRNVTERPDVAYARVGDKLTFCDNRYLKEQCNTVTDLILDTDYNYDELLNIFNNYRDCVALNIGELGKINNYEMKITLTSNKPIQYRPYRHSVAERSTMREMVDELLHHNIIRDSNSEYASPALLVSKKNGEKRLCIDYRALNKITVKDKYPIPRIEDLIDRLQGNKFYTSLDLKSGYYQLKMAEEAIHKTAFITEDGHFEFLRLPFGLSNGPSFFQQTISRVLGNLRFQNVIQYLDDILLVSKSIGDNIKLLETVLQIFKTSGLTLNLKKCHFLKTEIEFLGYRIKENSIKPSENKVEAVKNFPMPKSVHQVRQFLGLISYFRKFIKDCALLSSPLSKLLKKDVNWVWGETEINAFNTLKGKLTSDSVLTIYDPNKETILYTDASREGIAGILMQKFDDGEKPIHYYSRQTTYDEKKYHSFELELLAVICSLQKFRLYLLGTVFKIVTDCNAVRYALTKKDIVPRVSRWVLSTQEFSFDIVHREGMRMQHVDALSRNPVPVGEKSENEIIMSITEADWLMGVQMQDPEICKINETLLSGEAEQNRDIFDKYELLGNKVYRRSEFGRRWVVPKNCVWQIIKSNHDDVGHFAVDKTVELIKNKFWFPRIRNTVKKYIKNCLNCIYNKNKSGPKEGYLYSLPKYARPFHSLHLDHLGPFVETKNKNKYLLVTVDAFTKFVFVNAVRSTETKYVIKELENVSKIFGNPKRIISDAGTSFTSHNFTEYCKIRNIRLHTIATGMPRSNGQVERFNKTILEAMRAMGAEVDDDKWDECLKMLQIGINSTVHKTTKAVPSEVLLGYRLRGDKDLLGPELDIESKIDVTRLRQCVAENLESNAELQKQRFDKKRINAKNYQEGDLVLVKIQSQSNDGRSRKLLPVFKGPFKIVRSLGNDRYEISDIRGSERSNKYYTGTAAAEQIKPWINIADWDF